MTYRVDIWLTFQEWLDANEHFGERRLRLTRGVYGIPCIQEQRHLFGLIPWWWTVAYFGMHTSTPIRTPHERIATRLAPNPYFDVELCFP